jgi:hypothetical protein
MSTTRRESLLRGGLAILRRSRRFLIASKEGALREQIIGFAERRHPPAIFYQFREYAMAGELLSYATWNFSKGA